MYIPPLAVIGFTMTVCGGGDSGPVPIFPPIPSVVDLSGTWSGNALGLTAIVTITSSGWTLSTSVFSDRGTYIMNGTTAKLISTVYNLETGTAVLLNSNTISVTLNSNSIAPGTYTLYRQ